MGSGPSARLPLRRPRGRPRRRVGGALARVGTVRLRGRRGGQRLRRRRRSRPRRRPASARRAGRAPPRRRASGRSRPGSFRKTRLRSRSTSGAAFGSSAAARKSAVTAARGATRCSSSGAAAASARNETALRAALRTVPHDVSLIATVAVGLTFAFVGGFVAVRMGLPPLVGYLLAGIAVGPVHAGLRRATRTLAPQLAEIGVDPAHVRRRACTSRSRDLLAVRRIAMPGAIGQIAVATGARAPASRAVWGWSLGGRRSCSAWRCRSRARSCCCGRWRIEGCSNTERRADRGRLAGRRGPRHGARPGAPAGARAAPGRRAARAARSPPTSGWRSASPSARSRAFVGPDAGGRRRGSSRGCSQRVERDRLARAVHAGGARAVARRRVRIGRAVRRRRSRSARSSPGMVVNESDLSHRAATETAAAPGRVRACSSSSRSGCCSIPSILVARAAARLLAVARHRSWSASRSPRSAIVLALRDPAGDRR